MSSFLDELNNSDTSIQNTIKTKVEDDIGGIKNTEHEIEIDKFYNRNKIIRTIVIIISLILLISALIFIVKQVNKVEMMNFENKNISEMRTWSLKNSIQLDEKFVYNNTISENIVLTQSVKSGKKLSKKSIVNVKISRGANPDEKIKIPDFKSMTAPQIKQWITDKKLTNTQITEEESATIEVGHVIRSEFKDITVNKENFKRSDYLKIYVSKDKKSETSGKKVPDFTGVTKTKADEWATTNKINLKFTEKMSDSVAADKIISQDTKAKSNIKVGETINLVVSAGKGLDVPNYKRVFKDDATDYNTDFTVKIKTEYNLKIPYGVLISQSVASGSKVLPSKNNITLVYSEGKPFIKNLKGMHENELAQYFYTFAQKGTSFKYQRIHVNSKEEKGTIIWASKENEFVTMDEMIKIKISNGSLKESEEKTITIPNFSNILMEDAVNYNTDLIVSIKKQYSQTVKYGKLISQSVISGYKVSENKNKITLIYSVGKPYIKNLEDMTEKELETYFYSFTQKGANIKYQINYVFSDKKKGTIVSSSKYNEYIEMNDTVLINVSNGIKPTP